MSGLSMADVSLFDLISSLKFTPEMAATIPMVIYATFTTVGMIQTYWYSLMCVWGSKGIVQADLINRSLLRVPSFNLSGWKMAHICCYYAWTYTMPEHFLIIWCIGAAWEVVEDLLSRYTKGKKWNANTRKHSTVLLNGQVDYVEWWTGTYTDIFVNSAAMLVGRYVASQSLFILNAQLLVVFPCVMMYSTRLHWVNTSFILLFTCFVPYYYGWYAAVCATLPVDTTLILFCPN